MIVKITRLLGLFAFFLMSGCISDTNRSGAYKKSSTTCSTKSPINCSNTQLCNLISYTSMKAEARMRGLACVQQEKIQKTNVKTKKVNNKVFSSNASRAKVLKTKNITKSIEDGLNRIGCSVGKADGIIDDKTRAGLYSFTSKVGMDFKLKVLEDRNFLELIKSYPTKTCSKTKTATTATVKNPSSVTNSNTDNSAALSKLRQERELLKENLLATQQLFKQQKRAAERPYKACLANCLLNNKAGKGFAAAFSGMAQCNSSCAPLRWGGAVVPPSWEKNQKRLKRVDCMITRMNKNLATASCTQY